MNYVIRIKPGLDRNGNTTVSAEMYPAFVGNRQVTVKKRRQVGADETPGRAAFMVAVELAAERFCITEAEAQQRVKEARGPDDAAWMIFDDSR